MGEQQFKRSAVDCLGLGVTVIELRGDRGTAHLHDGSDLKDPQFYSRYETEDGKRLQLQEDGKTLVETASGASYILTA